MVVAGCVDSAVVGTRTEALEGNAWEQSQWISAVDAPVITDVVNGQEGHRRAADGASWFLSTVSNPGKVVSARWMTTALGICELYLNGKPVGTDALKPGFTHPQKTRISYTYDITEAFKKAAGTIRSAWKYEGDICTWRFSIPEGARASVTLPGENEVRTYGPGSYTLTIN